MGDLLGFTRNGSAYYYVRNGQNDIIGILNSAGQQVVSYEYDSWGKLLSVTGSEAETTGQLNPFRYRGYYYDSETSLYYLNSRYYDPACGRFLNADFAVGVNGDLISNNLFIYCSDNPISYQDPSGHGKISNFFKKAAEVIVTLVRNAATNQLRNSMIASGPQIKVSKTLDSNKTPVYGHWFGTRVWVGSKIAAVETRGGNKGFNYYYSNSDGKSGIGAQLGSLSFTQTMSKSTLSLEVADGVTHSVDMEIALGVISITSSITSVVDKVSASNYVQVDMNVGAFVVLCALFIVCAPAAIAVVTSTGGAQGVPATN